MSAAADGFLNASADFRIHVGHGNSRGVFPVAAPRELQPLAVGQAGQCAGRRRFGPAPRPRPSWTPAGACPHSPRCASTRRVDLRPGSLSTTPAIRSGCGRRHDHAQQRPEGGADDRDAAEVRAHRAETSDVLRRRRQLVVLPDPDPRPSGPAAQVGRRPRAARARRARQRREIAAVARQARKAQHRAAPPGRLRGIGRGSTVAGRRRHRSNDRSQRWRSCSLSCEILVR